MKELIILNAVAWSLWLLTQVMAPRTMGMVGICLAIYGLLMFLLGLMRDLGPKI